jgi:acyl carrier protein
MVPTQTCDRFWRLFGMKRALKPLQSVGFERVGFIFAAKRLNESLVVRGRGRGCGGEPLRPALCASRPAEPRTEVDVTEDPQEKTKLVAVIASEGMIDRAKVTPDATIESLNLKSVDIVMILTALEEKFNVYIPMDGSLQDAKDVKSLIAAIADHITKEREKS